MKTNSKKNKADQVFASELARYKAAFINSPTAVVLLDKNGRVLDINNRLADWLGYNRAEVLDKRLAQLPYFSASTRSKAVEKFKQRVAGEKLEPYRLEFISKTGERRIGEIYGKILRNKEGEIVADLLNIIDITKLVARQWESKRYLDLAKVLLVSLDGDGKVSFINKTGADILGYEISEIVGKNWFDNFLPISQREELRKGFLSLIGSDSKSIEDVFEEGGLNKVLTRDGTEKILIWNNSVLKDSRGNVAGTLSSGQDVTEREQLRRKLEENVERFNLMMKGTQDGLWDWDLRTNKVYFSPRWKEMLGYRDDEIPNKFSEWEKRLHPDDKDRVVKYVQQYVASKGLNPFQAEFRMKHKDGHWVDILARAFMQKNKKGENIRVVGSHVDLTQRKKNEKKIKEIRDRFERLTDNANEAIFQVDLNGGEIKYANRAAERIFGYTLSEYRQNPELGREIIDPNFAEKQASIIQEIAKSKKPLRKVILGWRAKNGRRVIMEHTIIPVADDSGKVTGFESIGRDITAERARKEFLRQREQQLREAQEIAKLGNWEWSIPDDNIAWSDEIKRIFEVTEAELPKTYDSFLKLVHPDDRKRLDNALKESLRGGADYEIDHRIKIKNGEIKYVHEQGKVFFGPRMKPIKMVGTSQDITERKEIENSLEEKVKDLERLNEVMVGRELKMIEMKEELAKLKGKKNGGNKSKT